MNYNGRTDFCMLMVKKYTNSKQNISKPNRICFLGKISKNFTVDKMKKTVLNEYLYDFSLNCNTIYVSDIIDNNKYLMKKYNINECLD